MTLLIYLIFLFNFQEFYLTTILKWLICFSKSQIYFTTLCHFLNGSELVSLILHFNTKFIFVNLLYWIFLKIWVWNENLFFLMGRFCCNNSYFDLHRMSKHFSPYSLSSLTPCVNESSVRLSHPAVFLVFVIPDYIRYPREEISVCFSKKQYMIVIIYIYKLPMNAQQCLQAQALVFLVFFLGFKGFQMRTVHSCLNWQANQCEYQVKPVLDTTVLS